MCVRVKAEDLLALNETLVNVKIGNPTLVTQVPQIHHCHHIMHVCIYIVCVWVCVCVGEFVCVSLCVCTGM